MVQTLKIFIVLCLIGTYQGWAIPIQSIVIMEKQIEVLERKPRHILKTQKVIPKCKKGTVPYWNAIAAKDLCRKIHKSYGR